MIKVTIRGIDVTVSSTAEAAALIRDFTGSTESKAALPSEDRPRIKLRPRKPTPAEAMTRDFLFRLASSSGTDVPTEEIMKILKVDTGRAVGGRCVKINNILARLGFDDTDEIYTNPRLAEVGRVWRPGPRIQEALEKLPNGR